MENKFEIELKEMKKKYKELKLMLETTYLILKDKEDYILELKSEIADMRGATNG